MAEVAMRINGENVTVNARNLLDILAQRDVTVDTKGVAVALNARVVPRARWAETVINPHDDLEIVHARQGG